MMSNIHHNLNFKGKGTNCVGLDLVFCQGQIKCQLILLLYSSGLDMMEGISTKNNG